MSEHHLSRRNFVASAGVATVAALGLFGCAPSVEGEKMGGSASASNVPSTWDLEADVVIVGGGTGLAAAVEAADGGAHVIVFEKAKETGGTTALSGGMMQAAGTKNQEAAGIVGDTPEKHAQFIIDAAYGYVDEDLVRDFTSGLAGHFEWLEGLGMVWDPKIVKMAHIPFLEDSPNHLARGHEPLGGMRGMGGKVQTDVLTKAAEERNVEFVFETEVTGLYRDSEKGVVGVQVNGPDGAKNVKASKGVVLAAGGIYRGEDLAEQYSPIELWYLRSEKATVQCAETNTGDGIRMGLQIGGAFQGPSSPLTGRNAVLGMGIYDKVAVPCIAVNDRGKRFAAEDASYAFFELAAWQECQINGDRIVIIFDQKAIDESANQTFAAGVPAFAESAIKADTIEELAEKLDMPTANLKATLDEWNANIEATGTDPVQGRNCGLVKIEAPFYAIEPAVSSIGCSGGLKIDTETRVLDTFGKVIPRLYAGGLNAGGWMGRFYPGSGSCIAGTVHWGRKAGRNAAAEENWG